MQIERKSLNLAAISENASVFINLCHKLSLGPSL